MNDMLSLLARTTLFSNLKEEQIGKVLKICKEVTFKKNEEIMREGDIGNTMYIIIDGTVQVIRNLVLDEMDSSENLGNKVFAKLSATENNCPVFGEITLLEESKRTATIEALTDCTLYEIRKDDFLALADKENEIGYRILLNMAKIVSSRLRKADEDIMKLTTVISIVLRES